MTAALRFFLAAAVACATAAVPASAQPPSQSSFRLLDVPFVPQSEELCGGAAAAMVMRYWGATGVYAESFAALVDREAGGIRGADLIGALQERGWQAVSLGGDAALVRASLDDRRPPIALIEDRPGRFHYVVVVSWFAGNVIVHDPARAPFRILDEPAFMRAWQRSGYWTLLALPPRSVTEAAKAAPSETVATLTTGPCGAMVDEAVRLANSGAVGEARGLLDVATATCPAAAAAWRELAGVHALHKEWGRAAAAARRAVRLDPGDAHAARTLATSLYLAGDPAGALMAWNQLGEPFIDLVEIRGLERTRFSAAAAAMGLAPRTRLTAAGLARAARRLDALPAAMGSRVSYTPGNEGLAKISAAVVERPVLPSSPLALAATALRAATERELRVDVASAAGGGELWHAAWRWWEPRPRVSLGIAAPAPFGGTIGIAAEDARETFGAAAARFEERRRSLALSVSDWATGSLAWEARVLRERWPSGSATGAVGLVQYLVAGDRFALRMRAGAWSAARPTWTGSASIDWRSAARNEGTVWLARIGADAAGAAAPRAFWSGAGTGQGREHLLRAHPLLDDGVIRGGVFGRALASGGGEWRRWGKPVYRVLRMAPAVFVDAGRAFDVSEFADRRGQVDAGAGLRLAIPGAGILRADLARGLRDGKVALSFGWTR